MPAVPALTGELEPAAPAAAEVPAAGELDPATAAWPDAPALAPAVTLGAERDPASPNGADMPAPPTAAAGGVPDVAAPAPAQPSAKHRTVTVPISLFIIGVDPRAALP
jgi:hypothetical protein